METAPSVIAKVNAVRGAILVTLERSSREPLSRFVADPACGPAHVVKVFDVHPCLGKVAGRRALRELGIAERTPLGTMDAATLSAVAGCCRCADG